MQHVLWPELLGVNNEGEVHDDGKEDREDEEEADGERKKDDGEGRVGDGEGQGKDGSHQEQDHIDHHPGQEEVGAEGGEKDGKDVDHHGEELQEQVEEQEDLLGLPVLPVVNKHDGEANQEGDKEDPACGDQLPGLHLGLPPHIDALPAAARCYIGGEKGIISGIRSIDHLKRVN